MMQRSSRHGAVIVNEAARVTARSIAGEAMDIGIERAKKHGVSSSASQTRIISAHRPWAEQCARAGGDPHSVNVQATSRSWRRSAARPRFTTNPFCAACRAGKEPIVLDFATSLVAVGKVRIANDKKVEMEEGLLIDSPAGPPPIPA